jgi:hypothetical protein
MVGPVVAAAPRAVTLGEQSIWTLFYVCSLPFLDGPSADLFNVLTSCHKVVALSSQLIFLVSDLALGGDSFITMEKSPLEHPLPIVDFQSSSKHRVVRAGSSEVGALPSSMHRHGVCMTTKP